MKRGEIWTAAAGSGGYVGKPRPVVIIQDDLFEATSSVTVGACTTDPTDAPLFRIPIAADELTGIREPSGLMVDRSRPCRAPNSASESGSSRTTT